MKKRIASCIILLFVLLVAYLCYTPKVKLQGERKLLDVTKTEPRNYLDEENYAEEMKNIVIPYVDEKVQEDYFQPEEGVQIRYRKYRIEDSKGSIVISHGFTESLEKYKELTYYFLKEGYSVYNMEFRGHGYSTRVVDDYSMVAIDDFYDYVSDFSYFVNEIVKPEIQDEKCYLFSHSMGGGIGARVIEMYPDMFDKAVFSSPMLDVKTGWVPQKVAKLITDVNMLLGRGNTYVAGQHPFQGIRDFSTCACSSENRYNYNFDIKASDEHYESTGSSYSWLYQSFRGTKDILKKKNMEKIKTPILLFQADDDNSVLPSGQNKFVNKVKSAQMLFVKGSRHELYTANNELLVPYMNTIFEFYEA